MSISNSCVSSVGATKDEPVIEPPPPIPADPPPDPPLVPPIDDPVAPAAPPIHDEVPHAGAVGEELGEDGNGNPSWKVPGGKIVWNVSSDSFDAHCYCANHKEDKRNPCRLNRTMKNKSKDRKTPQGRCVAFLLAWLAHGPACDDSKKHKLAAKMKTATAADKMALSRARRLDFRRWMRINKFALVGVERDPYTDEGEEPEGWP